MKKALIIILIISLQIVFGYLYSLGMYLLGIQAIFMKFLYPLGLSISVLLPSVISHYYIKWWDGENIIWKLLLGYIGASISIFLMYKYSFGGYVGMFFLPITFALISIYLFQIFTVFRKNRKGKRGQT